VLSKDFCVTFKLEKTNVQAVCLLFI